MKSKRRCTMKHFWYILDAFRTVFDIDSDWAMFAAICIVIDIMIAVTAILYVIVKVI
jgi:hypothetical protein